MLGVVKATGRSYRVDIGSALVASLPELAFEGATKRNKPNLQVSWEHIREWVCIGCEGCLYMYVCVDVYYVCRGVCALYGCMCIGGRAGLGQGEPCT